MINWKKQAWLKAMKEKSEEEEKIKEWVKTGEPDKIIKAIHEKNKNRIKAEDLPF
jgi:hypothetical protein